MRHICAWCGRDISLFDSKSDGLITHGICEECRKTEMVNFLSEKIGLSVNSIDSLSCVLSGN